MPNKHFCQGPNCHTNPTQDRFLKSKGIIRGRYALNTRDSTSNWYGRSKYFCSTRCESDWLNENMTLIERGIPVPFITDRRITEGYEKKSTIHEGWNGQTFTRHSIEKIQTQNS